MPITEYKLGKQAIERATTLPSEPVRPALEPFNKIDINQQPSGRQMFYLHQVNAAQELLDYHQQMIEYEKEKIQKGYSKDTDNKVKHHQYWADYYQNGIEKYQALYDEGLSEKANTSQLPPNPTDTYANRYGNNVTGIIQKLMDKAKGKFDAIEDPEQVEFNRHRMKLKEGGMPMLESHIDFNNGYNHRDFVLDLMAGNIPLEADGSLGTRGIKVAGMFADKRGLQLTPETEYAADFDADVASTIALQNKLINQAGPSGYLRQLNSIFEIIDQADEGIRSGRLNLLDDDGDDLTGFKSHHDFYVPPEVVSSEDLKSELFADLADSMVNNLKLSTIDRLASEGFKSNPLYTIGEIYKVADNAELYKYANAVINENISKEAVIKAQMKQRQMTDQIAKMKAQEFVEEINNQFAMTDKEYAKLHGTKEAAFRDTINAMISLRLLDFHTQLSKAGNIL